MNLEEKILIGRKLNDIYIHRAFILGLIAGKLRRGHIGSQELDEVKKDNADTDTELYNRFVY